VIFKRFLFCYKALAAKVIDWHAMQGSRPPGGCFFA